MNKQPMRLSDFANRRNGTRHMSVSHPISIKRTSGTACKERHVGSAGFTSTNMRVRQLRSGMDLMVPWNRASVEQKAIKEWKRAWKMKLIEKTDPEWVDLYETLR